MMSDIPSDLDISRLNSQYVKFKSRIHAQDEALNMEEDLEELEKEYADEDEDENYKDGGYEEFEEFEDEVFEEDGPLGETILRWVFRVLFKLKQFWIPIVLVLALLSGLTLWSRAYSTSDQLIIKTPGDVARSIQNLQWQINDINTRQKNKLHDLKNYLDLQIEQFTKKFQTLDTEIQTLKHENAIIMDKIDNISLDSVSIDQERIPIIIDSNHQVQLLPELKHYLQQLITRQLNSMEIPDNFKLNMETFLSKYTQEVINDKVGFMDRQEILHLITMQFQENKRKLIDEIKQLTKIARVDDVPSRLIPTKEVNPTPKINYAQASNGARIINYLTSQTFKPKTRGFSWFQRQQQPEEETPVSPFIVLTPNEAFWRSQDINTTLGIKFLEPIYMNEIQYEHQRVMNSALLTSCPRGFSIYVQSDDVELIKTHRTLEKIQGKFYKVGEFEYDLNQATIQTLPLEEWTSKLLVKSIIIKVEGNYGNEFFTSLYKLHIHGITRFDLLSMAKLLENDAIGEGVKRRFRLGTVKSFGDDDVQL